jgi:uncharacterized protein
MNLFLVTFAMIGIIVLLMSVGVIFGRKAIKGSCGGVGANGACICAEKCEKRKKYEASLGG